MCLLFSLAVCLVLSLQASSWIQVQLVFFFFFLNHLYTGAVHSTKLVLQPTTRPLCMERQRRQLIPCWYLHAPKDHIPCSTKHSRTSISMDKRGSPEPGLVHMSAVESERVMLRSRKGVVKGQPGPHNAGQKGGEVRC